MMSSAEGYRYCVYRLYASDGTLLYVGATRSFQARLDAHTAKPWWGLVDHSRTRTEWFPSIEATSDAESRIICDENPVHNKIGKAGQRRTAYKPPVSDDALRQAARRMTLAELKAHCEELEGLLNV